MYEQLHAFQCDRQTHMTERFLCNYLLYCFSETDPNTTIGYETPYVLPLICFKRHLQTNTPYLTIILTISLFSV
jgi:hypothetical protein